jgi:RNA-binding protein Nova
LFPGTLDRAVLITGALSHVLACQGLIWNKIAPSIQLDETSDDGLNLISGKLLVPSAASGLIIGRSGATIQLISETSGAKLQLSSKDDILNTKERILTLTGSLPSCIKATHQIIAKLG